MCMQAHAEGKGQYDHKSTVSLQDRIEASALQQSLVTKHNMLYAFQYNIWQPNLWLCRWQKIQEKWQLQSPATLLQKMAVNVKCSRRDYESQALGRHLKGVQHQNDNKDQVSMASIVSNDLHSILVWSLVDILVNFQYQDVLQKFGFCSPAVDVWPSLNLPNLSAAAAGMNSSICMKYGSDACMDPSGASLMA